jgi:hypothetical protein
VKGLAVSIAGRRPKASDVITGRPSRRDPRQLAYELGAAFAERLQIEGLLPFAVAKCREMLNTEGVRVLFLDRERDELYFPYVAEEDPAVAARLLEVRFPAHKGIVGRALRLGTALRIDDAPADPLFFDGADRCTGRATRALLCAPFTSRSGVSGVVEAVNPRDAQAFSNDDLALLDAFAHSLAKAFDNLENTCPPELDHRDRGLATAGDVFRQEGEYWTLVFRGHLARLRDAKGLHYIACLLQHPGQEIHVCNLLAVVGEAPPCRELGRQQDLRTCGLGDAGPLLDAQAKAAYKRRLDDLRGELEETERMNDPGRSAHVHAEIEALIGQLSAAIGLGGRDRHAASGAERARLGVTKRIRATVEKIWHINPALAHHLRATITTGYFCVYAPLATNATSWSFG